MNSWWISVKFISWTGRAGALNVVATGKMVLNENETDKQSEIVWEIPA